MAINPATKYSDPAELRLPAELYTRVRNYGGTDPLLQSISSQLIRFGKLSRKQWYAAHMHLKTSTDPSTTVPATTATSSVSPASDIVQLTPVPAVPSPVMTRVPIQLGTPLPIFINRTAAFRQIRDKYNLEYGIFALKIVKIHKAGRARNGNTYAEIDVVADAESSVSCCRICGKTLTDHRSIVSGIGPECAKRLGAVYTKYKQDVNLFMDAFKQHAASLGVMRIIVWRSQIKEHLPNFDFAVQTWSNQPLVPAQPATTPSNGTTVATPSPAAPTTATTINSKKVFIRSTDFIPTIPDVVMKGCPHGDMYLLIRPTKLRYTAPLVELQKVILHNLDTGNEMTFLQSTELKDFVCLTGEIHSKTVVLAVPFV